MRSITRQTRRWGARTRPTTVTSPVGAVGTVGAFAALATFVGLRTAGIGSSSLTWEPVASALAECHDVIAPDFLGHGASAKPRGDYSLGAFASGMRVM